MNDVTKGAPRARGLRLLTALLLIVVGASWCAARVQSDGGRVDVQGFRLPTHSGQWVVGDLFKPCSATPEEPAPLVIVVPGFQRSKEALSNIAIELARRGIVVMSIDPYAQGSSSSSMRRRAATDEGYGMFALVDYAADTGNLNYVDRARIATTGHSAGGNAAIRAAAYFGRESRATGEPCKLHSAFVSGYVLTLTKKVLRDVQCNVGASYAFYDEGAYRNELGNGDMSVAPEALRLIRSGLGSNAPALKAIEPGRYYGEAASGTLRVMYNERVLHPFQPYNAEATANQLEFFERVFGLEPELRREDQVWYWKELLSLLALAAALVLLIPLAQVWLQTPWFASLVHPLPAQQARPSGPGRGLFWGLFAFSALVACVSYIPLAELSKELFPDASNRVQTWLFPQRMNNAVMLWAALNGTLGLVLFFGAYHLHGRRNGAEPASWGLGVGARELGRTLLLAGLLFACFYALLFSVYYLFHVDYRFLFMGVRPFQPQMLVLLAMYAPVFFLFFLSNSLRVNGAMRFEGQPEWRSMLLAGGGELPWSDADRGRAVLGIRRHGHRLLDRWLALREPAVRRGADDVCPALLSPAVLPNDRPGLSGRDDHVPGVHHDPADEHRLLLAALIPPVHLEGAAMGRTSASSPPST